MKAENICKRFGEKTVLDNFSFDFPEGRCTAIMGRSGAGKTTLLRILSGLETADSGTVTEIPDGKKSFVFQENRLIESKSVIENILCVAPDVKRAEYYLEKSGLLADRNTKVRRLSGGMKRRLAIVRALSYGGDIFFLDEPLRELDKQTEQIMLTLLKDELAGKTVILISHDENQAQYLADCICSIS